jgi:hypothetical protein
MVAKGSMEIVDDQQNHAVGGEADD